MSHRSSLHIALSASALALIAGLAPAQAQADTQPPMRPGFHSGSVITGFGPVATVEGREPLPANATFSVAFDVAEAAKPGAINRTLESAARFINMHAEAGVPRDAVRVAVVVHGPASFDLTNAAAYARKHNGATNANLAAIAALIDNGVEIHLCGQSAAGQGIARSDLAPGVRMQLSAMTAHALLQQQGYTLNPF
ncbi:DsrE family protein [Blastomonas sp.]|jgi:intracellular sulfur oxidation DsrE/DsrF family protein|uniref:DsrE family protein n=1 Tax=Blastomonas TaxID=150203 RepID=UPI002587878F|nr:DsrE family protein [Blastomonas sp.]